MKNRNHFDLIGKVLSTTLPYAGVFIIVGVFLVTGVLTGIAMKPISGNPYLWGAVGVFTQLIAGFIIFNRQLFPELITYKFNYAFIASGILGVLRIVEVWYLFPRAQAVSLSLMVISSVVVEMIFLRELDRHNKVKLIRNPDKLAELKKYHYSNMELQLYLDTIEQETRQALEQYTPTPLQDKIIDLSNDKGIDDLVLKAVQSEIDQLIQDALNAGLPREYVTGLGDKVNLHIQKGELGKAKDAVNYYRKELNLYKSGN